MDPKKESVLLVFAQPVERLVHHFITRALSLVEVCFSQRADVEVIVVKIKAAV